MDVIKQLFGDKRNLAKWGAGICLVILFGFAEADTTLIGKDVLTKEKANEYAVYVLALFGGLNRSAPKKEA